MAKAKKGKIEEQKGGENSGSEAVVKHQKLCLSIDVEKRRLYGYMEMKIVVPENGIVGLHADNLVIENVTVEGEPAEFEVFPHYQHLDTKDRWCDVSSTTSAADASGSVYLSSLEVELLPNLLIMCSKSHNVDNEQENPAQMDNGNASASDACRSLSGFVIPKNVKNIRIDYWVEKAETGIHFYKNVLHTDNQLRRARCWFPCMDDNLQCCCYNLEFTVASNLVAVSSGTLLHQVSTNDDPPRKTYIYQLDIPVPAHLISLTVAPFEVLADPHVGILRHFCLPPNLSKMRNTVAFFHNAFSHYEDYLSAPFPFGTYSQVFISPEMTASSWVLGASISVFSSHLLFDEKLLDQTIETRIKLAYALAKQWFGVYIIPDDPTDEWLMDGLAGFMTDTFIKKFLGNNEARSRRYKYKCAVCQVDDSGATALSSVHASKDLYGTQSIGFYGKIRSWKSVAVLQMLEKQMGPESFRKILQNIVMRARDSNHSLRSLSTKEFRHYANKIGNLERPFLKEFFPRWIGFCGCPFVKMGFSYNKRKNMVELAVLRGCTSRPESWAGFGNKTHDSENRDGIMGWPGMMSIRVHEIDGMHDHPILLMSGEPWQLLEIQCHSKLAAKRLQKPKKGAKADGSDDNVDVMTTDVRPTSDSPLLWLRADPEMEYLAEVQLNQPLQMWINQLEKDKDVVAQAQAIAVLISLPEFSFPVVNALSNFLNDSKAFWRIRIQAAYALATTACEETDWSGLLHLINFYKSKRFDPKIGLPRPNEFSDFQEYFVLQAIPHAIAMVRSSDKRSPREAVEFILQLLKYNDNSGNPYSDVFWVASLVQSVGELEFGEQTIVYLTSLLKRLDRLLQFESLMPSHNGILTVSCIQSLTQIAIKLSEFLPLDNIFLLINPYRASKTWQIRVAASRSLLELEFHFKGIDAALTLFFRYLGDETSLRGQTKLGHCTFRLCQMAHESDGDNTIKSTTLVTLLRLLESPLSFNNIYLRHYVFCILQVLAKRVPTLYRVPRDETLRMGHIKTSTQLKDIFAALVKQSKTPEQTELPSSPAVELTDALKMHDEPSHAPDASMFSSALQIADIPMEVGAEWIEPESHLPSHLPEIMMPAQDQQSINQLAVSAGRNDLDAEFRKGDMIHTDHQQIEPATELEHLGITIPDVPREPTTLPNVVEVKKPKLRIKVKQHVASSHAENQVRVYIPPEGPVNDRILNPDEQIDGDRGACSFVSIDAPHRNLVETVSTSNQNIEDASSCQDVGSRVTASIGSARPAISGDEQLVRELQCTADSSKISLPMTSEDGLPPTSTMKFDNEREATAEPQASARVKSEPQDDVAKPAVKEKEKKKEHKSKRSGHHDDPDRKERKRQKKEKKRLEKEMAKLLAENKQTEPELATQEKTPVAVNLETKTPIAPPPSVTRMDSEVGQGVVNMETQRKSEASSGGGVSSSSKPEVNVAPLGNRTDSKDAAPTPPARSSLKIKIKYKNRTIGNT